MKEDKKIANTEQQIETTDKTISSKEEMTENYKVGYGRPPKNSRFQKGRSGNPSGRRKKARDLDAELSSELNSLITIKDRGKQKRIPKLRGIFIQLGNKALSGDMRAVRILLAYYQQILERAALQAEQQPSAIEKMDPSELTDEQLTWIAAQGLRKTEEEK